MEGREVLHPPSGQANSFLEQLLFLKEFLFKFLFNLQNMAGETFSERPFFSHLPPPNATENRKSVFIYPTRFSVFSSLPAYRFQLPTLKLLQEKVSYNCRCLPKRFTVNGKIYCNCKCLLKRLTANGKVNCNCQCL